MTNNLIEQLRPNAAMTQPGKDWFSPLSGWLLSTLIRLEEDCGGTCPPSAPMRQIEGFV